MDIENIIQEFKNNDYSHFDIFYESTRKQVFTTIFSIVKNHSHSDDLMQDTYLRFIKYINKYKEGTNPVAFIVTIARNLALNHYKKYKRVIHTDFDFDVLISDDPFKSSSPLYALVLETLDGLELEVFIYHAVSSLKHKEIADMLKKPIGTITWTYNNAVKKLRERLGEGYDF